MNLSDKDSAAMKPLERRAERRLKHPESTEVRWISYRGKRKFLRSIRTGDWVVDCMKDGGARYVGPPAQVLAEEKWISSRGTKWAVLMLESPSRGERMTLSQFRKTAKGIEKELDNPNPRTRPIPSNDHADRILRLWTESGKIAK